VNVTLRERQGTPDAPAGRVEFRHVKAHKTNPYNKRVDKLAKDAADIAQRQRLAPKMVARKSSPRKTEPRAVPMRGQTKTFRIRDRK